MFFQGKLLNKMLLNLFFLFFVFGERVLELGVVEKLKQGWIQIHWFGREMIGAVSTGQKGNLRDVAAVDLVGHCTEAELQTRLTPRLRKSEKLLGH